MLRPILPLLVFFIMATPLVAQHWIGSAGLNYGTYSMKSLKDMQKAEFPSVIPLEIVESFPSRAGFEISILRSFGNFSVGGFFSKASTGGRVSYADYSGSINHDIIANNSVIAVQLEKAFIKRDSWEFFVTMRSGMALNTMTYQSTLSLGTASDDLKEKFKSHNFLISPGLAARIFYKNIFLHPEVRYESHIVKGDFHYSENKDEDLEVNDKKVQAGWDGIRLSLSLGYRI